MGYDRDVSHHCQCLHHPSISSHPQTDVNSAACLALSFATGLTSCVRRSVHSELFVITLAMMTCAFCASPIARIECETGGGCVGSCRWHPSGAGTEIQHHSAEAAGAAAVPAAGSLAEVMHRFCCFSHAASCMCLRTLHQGCFCMCRCDSMVHRQQDLRELEGP